MIIDIRKILKDIAEDYKVPKSIDIRMRNKIFKDKTKENGNVGHENGNSRIGK